VIDAREWLVESIPAEALLSLEVIESILATLASSSLPSVADRS
jgi:hypothetical protein